MASLSKHFRTKLAISDVSPTIWTTSLGDLTYDDLSSQGLSDQMISDELDAYYRASHYDHDDWSKYYDDAYQLECWNTLMILFPNHQSLCDDADKTWNSVWLHPDYPDDTCYYESCDSYMDRWPEFFS